MSKPIVLKIYRNGGVVDIKQFTTEQQIVLGSSAGDTQVKLEGQVSPFHAAIEKRGDKYVLSDLGSSQGTYLKGAKVLEAGLDHGDKIAIGEYIIEFYIGAPTAGASAPSATVAPAGTAAPAASSHVQTTTVAPQQSTRPLSQVVSSTVTSAVESSPTGSVSVGIRKGKKAKGEKTFAPASAHKNLSEFVKPTKGSTLEVLVAWRERIIQSYHFHHRGTFTYGSHPSCDILVPALSSNTNKAPLLQLEGQAKVFIPAGMQGSLVVENNSIPLTQIYNQGRLQAAAGGGSTLTLAQGEMIRINVGADVELVIRYCSETPKPVFIPMLDFASNGFLAVLLAVIMAIVASLYVALNKVETKDIDEGEYRTALIIENPPKPPPMEKVPKIEEVKPPEKEIEQPKKKVKLEQPKETPKPVVDKKIEQPKQREAVKQQPQQAATAASGGDGKLAKSMKPNPNKPKSNQPGSVKQGGSVKTSDRDGSQAESKTKDPSKSGIFGVFGSGGKNDRLDNTYSGGGQLAGLADSSTGKSGFGEDRAGDGLGSKLKETGGGQGKSNVGVSGISRGTGMGTGTGGFGGTGLGGKGTVTILPGGDAETSGGNIDRNGIRQVFLNNQRTLQSCYESALASDRGLSGKLVLDFDIGEQGRVLRADFSRDKSTLTNSQLANCVINRMKSWRFPEPPANQTVQVFYPLAFSGK